jgi:hypothetical protein
MPGRSSATLGRPGASVSLDLLVIFATSNAPNADAWSQALSEAHAPVSFSLTVDLRHHTGFIPVQVHGRESGFYFGTESYNDVVALYPAISKLHLAKPTIYSLSYGGHFDECAAAFFSASVLVSRFHGVAFDPQSGALMTAKQLADAGSQCLTLSPK